MGRYLFIDMLYVMYMLMTSNRLILTTLI